MEGIVMFSCFVRADRLRLAALFQSKEPTRPYLHGVFIEPMEEGARLCATDGVMMGIFRDEVAIATHPMIINVPKAGLRAIKAVRKHEEQVWFGIIGAADQPGRHEARIFDTSDTGLTSLVDIRDAMLDPVHDGVIWSGAVLVLEGEYPAFEKVVPARRLDLAEGTAFAAYRLAPFQEVARSVSALEVVRMFPGGVDAAIAIDCGRGDFVGILMGCQYAKAASFGGAGPHAMLADWSREHTRDTRSRFEDQAVAPAAEA
jgi:hypothetical protein